MIDGTVPFIREKPRDVALVEGAPLELTCLVESDPLAAVTWYKNDLIFMDDSRLRVINDQNGRSTLCIDPAVQSDVGLYRVRDMRMMNSIIVSDRSVQLKRES